MYRNIMVPVDGSRFSREAVFQGLRLASKSGAILRLVRVGTPATIAAAPDGFEMESHRLREIHSAELAELYSIAAECRAHTTVNVTASIQYGPIVETLIGYAKRQKVDLIVMRSHGRKGLARVWFGSVTDALIRDSGIPVLVAKGSSIATAVENGFVNRILVPLDGSLLAEQSIEPAVRLARINGASITLLMVVAPSKNRSTADVTSSIGPAAASEVANAQRYLETCLGPHFQRSVKVFRRVIVAEDVAATILVQAGSMDADLVAIATRGRGAIARATSGSVADQVVRQSPVSTMVIHPVLQLADFQPAFMQAVPA